MLKINELTRLYLGIQGENEAQTISIDVSPWMVNHPRGSVTIWHKRNGDEEPRPTGAEFSIQAGVLTWSPTGTDTYVAGEGVAEIRLYEDGIIKKTKPVITGVSPSVTGAGVPLGSDWQSYINAVDAERQAAVAARAQAEAWATGQIEGVDVGEESEAFENNAKYWALKAAGADKAEITAEAWAVGKRNGENVPATDPAHNNNAKYWAEQARIDREKTDRSAQTVTRAEEAASAAERAAELANETFSNLGLYIDEDGDICQTD